MSLAFPEILSSSVSWSLQLSPRDTRKCTKHIIHDWASHRDQFLESIRKKTRLVKLPQMMGQITCVVYHGWGTIRTSVGTTYVLKLILFCRVLIESIRLNATKLHLMYVTVPVLLCPTSCIYHIHAQGERTVDVQKLLNTYSYIVHIIAACVYSCV